LYQLWKDKFRQKGIIMGGDKYERELVNTFDAFDIPSMRAPSSGSATQRELPDVLTLQPQPQHTIKDKIQTLLPEYKHRKAVETIANDIGSLSQAYAIELKSGEGTTLYVGGDEVDKLLNFCEDSGAIPRIAARFTERKHPVKHFLVHPNNARMTEEGNYGLPVDDIEERASEIITPETTTKDPAINLDETVTI
jgi:Holliday junction resolvase